MGGNDFAWALQEMVEGRRVARCGWNGKGIWIAAQFPDENSKMQKPYVYISPVDGKLVPWTASQTDILAEDWVSVT